MELLDICIIFGAPIILICVFTLPFLRVGINLADEGYLVFGVSNLLNGQVPIRDFRSYDPGRYYWCGFFALIFGRGFVSIRIAMAVMMTLALSALAALMQQVADSAILTILTCMLVLIWMQPRHKQIENFFVILSLLLLFNVTVNGSVVDFALLGFAIGLSAFFGLNILIYMFGASFLTSILIFDALDTSDIIAFGLSGLLGCVPIIVMAIIYKDYARVYYQRKVSALIKRGSTNLKLPLPWVWAADKTGLQFIPRLLFTVMPVIFLGGMGVPLFFGTTGVGSSTMVIYVASCVGLVNFYHTLSRADLGHFFMPMLPFCVLVVAIADAMFGVTAASFLAVILIIVSAKLVWKQFFHMPVYLSRKQDLTPLLMPTEYLLLPTQLAQQMEQLQNVVNRWTKPGEPILSVPMQIGLCEITKRPHAVYDSFPVYPSTPVIRKNMINSLRQSYPKLMLIGTNAIDQRAELMFLKNYPEVADFLASEYVLSEKVDDIEVYVRRDLFEQLNSNE